MSNYLKGYNNLTKPNTTLNENTKSKIEETINKRANLIKKSNVLEYFKDSNVNCLIQMKSNKNTIAYFSPKAKINSNMKTISNALTVNSNNNISSLKPRSKSKSKEKNLITESDLQCSYVETEQCEENQTKYLNYTEINKVNFFLPLQKKNIRTFQKSSLINNKINMPNKDNSTPKINIIKSNMQPNKNYNTIKNNNNTIEPIINSLKSENVSQTKASSQGEVICYESKKKIIFEYRKMFEFSNFCADKIKEIKENESDYENSVNILTHILSIQRVKLIFLIFFRKIS